MTGSSQIYNTEDSRKSLIVLLERYSDLILEKSLHFLNSESGMKLVVGLEIELYISKCSDEKADINNKALNDIIADINLRCKEFASFMTAEPEKGLNQIEIKTVANSKIADLLTEADLVIEAVNDYLKERSIATIYKARPYDDDCANALQINFSLKSNNNINVFSSDPELMAKISDYLVRYLDEILIFSNTNEEDFARYDVDYNRTIFKKGKFVAPTYKSWGYDNRTCAVRVVKSSEDIHNSHIELRIPSNSANLKMSVAAIAIIVEKFYQDMASYQVVNKAVYGNSFDANYNLQKISNSYSQSLEDFFSSPSLIMKKMQNILQSNNLF